MWSLTENMKILKRKMKDVVSRGDDVSEGLIYAESLGLKKPKKVVQNWLKDVEIFQTDFQRIEQKVQERGWGISNFTLPNDVDRLTVRATELLQDGNFAGGLTLETGRSKGVSLLTRNLVGGAFEKNKDDICRWLQSDEGSSVGVYGMGGAGKTTLLAHVHNQLQNATNTSVSWVTVPQNFSIFELQSRIAKTVGINLSKIGDERKRALYLNRVLSIQKKLVLILEDVRQYICADKVGIPMGANGIKLILSTRSLDLCRKMNCDNMIKVEPLSSEEAWELFLETLGRETSLPPQIEEIARSLIGNCGGLPLGIVIMAGCMKGVDDICQWRNALESKEVQEDMKTNVFQVLRYSYDNLNDTTVQQCFLYCSLFPQDHEIERQKLIQYLIDDRLIDNRKTRQGKFDRGHTILNKLENACLLEGGKFTDSERKYVKMHDLIRNMALQITSTSPRFLVEAGVGLKDILEDEMWSKDLVRVSLMHNYRLSLPFNASPRCPRLSTLLLNNSRIERLPEKIFRYMNELTVLDLSHNPITYVPSLGNLTALRRLDLSYTRITQLPQGFESLVNLRYLNLEGTLIEKIPRGILSKFCNLENLKLLDSAVKVTAEELSSFKYLETFTGTLSQI